MIKNADIRYDALLVPGGGIRADGEPPEWVQARLNKAIELMESARFIIALSAGTTHKPFLLDHEGFPFYESEASAAYLTHNGAAKEKILTERSSLDTIGNAFFARFIHTEPLGLRKLLVITNEFHMPRTRRIFNWVFSLNFQGNAPESDKNYHLEFLPVPDLGMDHTLLEIRLIKEHRSLEQLENIIGKITNGWEFHQWLFSQHQAYAPLLKPGREKGAVRETY